MRFSMVVAHDLNGGIGKDGTMPWPRLPKDMARFKAVTMGKPVILGRKTWDSIGKPLPGRNLIVLSRDAGFSAQGVQVARDVTMAIDLAAGWGDECVVAGGAEVYFAFLSMCERCYLTEIKASYSCDTYFDVGPQWNIAHRETIPADEKNPVEMEFLDLVRPSGWRR